MAEREPLVRASTSAGVAGGLGLAVPAIVWAVDRTDLSSSAPRTIVAGAVMILLVALAARHTRARIPVDTWEPAAPVSVGRSVVDGAGLFLLFAVLGGLLSLAVGGWGGLVLTVILAATPVGRCLALVLAERRRGLIYVERDDSPDAFVALRP